MKRICLILLALLPLLVSAQGVIRRPTKPQQKPNSSQTQPRQQPRQQKPSQQKPTQPRATVSDPTGYAEGHGYVDLGLSVKWATMNVGASSPSDYGNYYAWGETSTKSSYTEENSRTYNRNFTDIAGDPTYDAARANWGGSWRLPTKAELEELKDKCNWTWTTVGGHKGYIVKSKSNGRSIFLPAAGWRYGTSLSRVGDRGSYWGSTPSESDAQGACYLYFGGSDRGVRWRRRGYGDSVRAVRE